MALWYALCMPIEQRTEPRDWREGRRLRAWELHTQGWRQKDIAAALGVTPAAVSQWLTRGRDGGLDRLRRQPPPGARPRLSPDQLVETAWTLGAGGGSLRFSRCGLDQSARRGRD